GRGIGAVLRETSSKLRLVGRPARLGVDVALELLYRGLDAARSRSMLRYEYLCGDTRCAIAVDRHPDPAPFRLELDGHGGKLAAGGFPGFPCAGADERHRIGCEVRKAHPLLLEKRSGASNHVLFRS